MIGAVAGDIIGSPYEFDDRNIKTVDFPLFSAGSRYTDDSVMTIAVAEALTETVGASDDEVYAAVESRMRQLGLRYPKAGYGGRFNRWLHDASMGPYRSYGNGSAMRVSSAGWLYGTMEETLKYAQITASVTHDHPEGIKGAQATAAAIYLARTGADQDTVKAYVGQRFGYDLDTPLDVIRPGYHFDVTCQGSVPQAIRAYLEGSDYESTVRLAVSIGGDSDTIACIAGSIAEAAWGVPESIAEQALTYLTDDLRDRLLRAEGFKRL